MPEAVKRAARLPRVVILATGGTIAGVQPDAGSTAYHAGTLTAAQLTAAVPQLQRLARIHSEQIANVGSQSMTHAIWHALAQRIRTLADDEDTDGVVITHGTDTLEETAFFLSLTVPSAKPLVFASAMRPATALSADGPANLYHAVALATSAAAAHRGPLAVMNGEIHGARDVQKMAAESLHAFASPNCGKAGVMLGQVAHFHAPAAPHTPIWAGQAIPEPQRWPRVGIVYAHADMQPDIIEAMTERYDGIVLAGVGEGNASDAAVQALGVAASRGVVVVRASRTGSGFVSHAELDSVAGRFIAAGNLSPQKARILLMLALLEKPTESRLRQLFASF